MVDFLKADYYINRINGYLWVFKQFFCVFFMNDFGLVTSDCLILDYYIASSELRLLSWSFKFSKLDRNKMTSWLVLISLLFIYIGYFYLSLCVYRLFLFNMTAIEITIEISIEIEIYFNIRVCCCCFFLLFIIHIRQKI